PDARRPRAQDRPVPEAGGRLHRGHANPSRAGTRGRGIPLRLAGATGGRGAVSRGGHRGTTRQGIPRASTPAAAPRDARPHAARATAPLPRALIRRPCLPFALSENAGDPPALVPF